MAGAETKIASNGQQSRRLAGVGFDRPGYLAINKQGFVVLNRSIFDVVHDFLHDEAIEGQEKVLTRYLKPDLLIVDDMGMKQLPRRSGEACRISVLTLLHKEDMCS